MKKSALLLPLLAALVAAQPAAASDDRPIVARSWAKDDLGNKPLYSAVLVRGNPWNINVTYWDYQNKTMKQYTWDDSNMYVKMNQNSPKIGQFYYEHGSSDMYVEAALRKSFKPAHYFKHIGKTADFSEQVIRIACSSRRVATLTETYYLGNKMVYQNLTRPDPLIWREFGYDEMENDLGRELCFL